MPIPPVTVASRETGQTPPCLVLSRPLNVLKRVASLEEDIERIEADIQGLLPHRCLAD